jgi:dihydroorotase
MALEKAHCNFGLFFGANPSNLDEARNADNVPGLKIFMGCSTGDLLVYERDDLERIFAGYEGRICVHAESELRLREREAVFADRDDVDVHSIIRDDVAAAEAVGMAADLAKQYDRHLHILHLSTQLELDVLSEVGANTTCEVCPHHLFWNTDTYDEWGTFARMNPPIRSEADRAEMWTALQDGRIDMVATDHAPHTIEEKSRPYRQAPSGVPGVETMLPMMLDAAARGVCTHEKALDWLCHAPARVYGIVDRHRLEVGNWPDLVVIDPKLRRTIRDEDQFSRCAWTPWRGRATRGWPTMTFVNGELAFSREDDGPGRIHETRGVEVTFGR